MNNLDNNTASTPTDATGFPPPPKSTSLDDNLGQLLVALGGFIAGQDNKISGVDLRSASSVEAAVETNKTISGVADTIRQLFPPNDALVEEGVSNMVLDGFANRAPTDQEQFALNLIAEGQAKAVNGEDTNLTRLAASIGPVGEGGPTREQANLFLGGLVMVALFETLSDQANIQRQIEKLASEMKLKEQALATAAAEEQAELVKRIAEIKATQLIMQAAMSIATGALSIAGARFALKSDVPTITHAMWSAGSNMLDSIGQKSAEAIGTLMTADLEARKIILEAYANQLNMSMRSMDELGSDAHSLQDKIHDALKNYSAANAQLYKNIGGGH